MSKNKKQFSLTLVMRVALAVLVVTSIIVFANRVMQYNALLEEQKRLEEELADHREIQAELEEYLGAEVDREYIIRVAKSMGLHFPEEEIFYNDVNK